MNVDKKRQELALYRLQQAEESFDEARYLLEGNKSPRSIINRIYYAMFYAILALLIFEPFSTSKHTGAISYFNSRFIKEGVLPKELGLAVNKAFDLRQRGDYREKVVLTIDQIIPFFDQSREFIDSVRNYLKESKRIII